MTLDISKLRRVKVGDDIQGAAVQQKLLSTILNAWDTQRRIPTFEELARQLGMAKSGVQTAIKKLLDKHYLECERTPSGNVRAGSLRPTGKALKWQREAWGQGTLESGQLLTEESDTRPVRVRGEAAAGERILVSEESGADDEYMPLPYQHVRHADVFLLEVSGESMSGDDLHSGDHLIVDPHARFSDGDMVVVLDRGAVRVKRLWDDGSRIVLESSNSEYEPIRLEKGREHLSGPAIQGKVIGRVLWHVKPGRRNKQNS
jgi:SOS-response transcriptional repressor LexA